MGKSAIDTIREWQQQQPSLSAELGAMGREGIKDIRQTLNEAFFGAGEHAPELGTPLNPVQREVFDARHQESQKDHEMDI